ncbi:secreted RxLR effector peptide protein, putative [Phytophthora infestans T30-4]|uniref:RxLR effector protein Avr10 n=2 Tax=Phytophthora infestans TaxID=4787 RepID=AVR10_PHYIT|nr:secreted RxLR effector peptide protein, putative [Phytophthora infestans T30-4]D0NIW0.1 RecName: Full=RxLR effector protein Avr10; AltName: Full=Avirulence protein 10; Flags: Precursor [Phytophthora infestans T30-4]EEY59444.1 secreted RxLR effector peptide protein, putative [Phytophthora infestans T30-4]KAF4039574.1 RXLR phytopathogen effector protein [Phytophthora infestans]KAF4141176.1 RXLR phytopathogen effector protein [Phytophthora infestans]|eukprot:XP_002901054.1 secreted RxLR effector peptide protein, putative [Phytophthora infestans T30-4]
MRLSFIIFAISLLAGGSGAAEALHPASDVLTLRGTNQGASTGKRSLRYDNNAERAGEEDDEERAFPGAEELSRLANLAHTSKADSLGTSLKNFFKQLDKANVNPSNIHKYGFSGEEFDQLRKRFGTWYRHYKDIE